MAVRRQPGLEPAFVVGVLGCEGIGLSFVSWLAFSRMGVMAWVGGGV